MSHKWGGACMDTSGHKSGVVDTSCHKKSGRHIMSQKWSGRHIMSHVMFSIYIPI